MEYFCIKDNKKFQSKMIKKVVKFYTDEDVYDKVYKRVKKQKYTVDKVDITSIIEACINTQAQEKKQFSYKGKIYSSAKACFEELNIPISKGYNYKYHQAIKSDKSIIELDDVIDYVPAKRVTLTFDDALIKIKKWYEENDKDPSLTSTNPEEKKIANKVQNFRKAYKNYVLIQNKQQPLTNHIISEESIEKLNQIGFKWENKRIKKNIKIKNKTK